MYIYSIRTKYVCMVCMCLRLDAIVQMKKKNNKFF